MLNEEVFLMEIFQGKSVYHGIAIGKIHVFEKQSSQVVRKKVTDTQAEIERFEDAREAASSQLQKLYEKALKEVGEASAAIFEVHQMMLQDDDYLDSILGIIRDQEVNAEYAVAITGERFSDMFSSMEDAYMKERAADVKDISERLVNVLTGAGEHSALGAEPVILLADDLAPSETVQLDKNLILSFVTVHGSTNSHTAILARTMGIPALVSTGIKEIKSYDGMMAIVDGTEGKVYLDPTYNVLEQKKEEQKKELEQKELLQTLKGKETVTLDGHKVMLYANIGNVKDLAHVITNDAGGIGLFRSEFVYLESEDYPTEDEQFQIYKTVAETMAGKRVIIRTCDIGADKQVEYFDMPKEENPAMGVRAIRICLKRKDFFKTQLRALFRASAYGKIAIMYPMITSQEEIWKIKEIVAEVKGELTNEGIPFRNVEQGIMIETPAAAVISDLLAKEVDFFSIGTNDLSQYTMAIDRQNTELDEFFDPYHPAVLRMIKMVVENAHKAGIWVGICGELGADLKLTTTFLKMGVDELSVSPAAVLPLRKVIRETEVCKIKDEFLF